MIRVEHLTKCFGRKVAVDDISFTVRQGEIVGFLGPNGAGKTTTMRILSCFLSATGGKVTIGDLDVFRDSLEVRRKIGYLPESVPLYTDMRVGEYLTYRAKLKGLHGPKLRARVDDVVLQCDLVDVYRSVIGTLSKGFRQRVGLADSLVHEPGLLILDEPTLGLDPNQIRSVRHLIKSLAGRYTVLLSSHILHEIESVCERVVIMNGGRIVTSDTTESLMAVIKGHSVVTVEVHGPAEEMEKRVQSLPGVARLSSEVLERGWIRYRIECRKGRDVRTDLFHMASLSGWNLRELREEKRNLEDVFVSVTAGLEKDGQVAPEAEIVIEEGEAP